MLVILSSLFAAFKTSKEPVFYSTVIPHLVHAGTTRHLGSCSKRGIFWRQTSEWLITSTCPCASVNAPASPGMKLATTHVGNFVNSTLISWPRAFTLSRSTTHHQNWILCCPNYPRSPSLLIPLRTVLLPQPRLRLSFFKASPHLWSQPSALSPTRRVDTPTGSAFPQLWEGGVSILLSPSEGRAAYGYSTASKERQQS